MITNKLHVNIKLNPGDFLLVHKLLAGLDIIEAYEDSTLENLVGQDVGYFYVRGTSTGWDRPNRHGYTRTDIDLTDVAIPVTHTMILDGEEVEVSEKAYNQIKEFISCE